MLDWWTELPAWLRITVGAILLLIGVGIIWGRINGVVGGRRGYTAGFAIAGLGFCMMVFGGKTDSEKNGYHF